MMMKTKFSMMKNMVSMMTSKNTEKRSTMKKVIMTKRMLTMGTKKLGLMMMRKNMTKKKKVMMRKTKRRTVKMEQKIKTIQMMEEENQEARIKEQARAQPLPKVPIAMWFDHLVLVLKV